MFSPQGIRPIVRSLNPSRSLFTLNTGRRIGYSEVVLANNAGLFGTYWSLMNHDHDDHKKVTVIQLPFWLDKVHPQYHSLDWGQTTLGFHRFIRGILKILHPNFPSDKYVTWKMILEAKAFVIEQIKKCPDIQYQDLSDYDIDALYENQFSVVSEENQFSFKHKQNTLLSLPRDSFFYNWARVARKHTSNQYPSIPHTTLYNLPPTKIPQEILVLGSGLSTIWLKKHFNDTQIFVLVSDRNVSLPRIPNNDGAAYKDIILVTLDELLIKDDGSFVIPKGISSKLSSDRVIPHERFLTAIGLMPASQLTANIPDKQKLEIPENLVGKWIAPKNIPVGSLAQSLARFFEETENFRDTFEMQFSHSNIAEQIRSKLHDSGIAINDNFFDTLETRIRTLANPVSSDLELNMFIEIFNEANNPSTSERSEFKKCISEIQASINARESVENRHQRSSKAKAITPSTGRRSFSTTAVPMPSPTTTSQGAKPLNPEIKSQFREILSIFFYGSNPEKVSEYDHSLSAKPLAEKDKEALKESLKEAEHSFKNFSAY